MDRRPRFNMRKRRRLRRMTAAGMLALLLVGVWAAGFVWFVSDLPREVDDRERRTDAIVVLTGGAGRVDQGLALLAEGRAEMLFVSGVYRSVDVPELLRVSQGAPQDLACCVALGYEAHSTLGNAEESARWVAANGFSSLRLVTSAYHMPRSMLEFRRRMPDVDIVPHPVFADRAAEDGWWRWRGRTHLLLVEYNKYVVALARAALVAPAE